LRFAKTPRPHLRETAGNITRGGLRPGTTMTRSRISRSGAVFTAAVLLGAAANSANAQMANYQVVGDGIPQSLTGKPGDAARGKALLVKREAANCLSCHSIKGLPDGGLKGPSLDGVGASLTAAQLRLSVVDTSRVSRGSAMPSFHKSAALGGDSPRLTAAEVEDVVAYLATLRK
jgi:sulfur-oxidizing protein SoxX